MSNLVRSRALILKKTKYKESDLILQVLLVNGNKISLLARGALKSKKRFGGGVLEPTHFIEMEFKEPKDSGLGVLEQAQLIEDFQGIRKSYEHLELAFFMVSTVSKISQEADVQAEGIFNLLGHSLNLLQKLDDLDLLRAVFSLKLLFQQGVLDAESWMSEALKMPLKDWNQIEKKFAVSAAQKIWIQSNLDQYLSHAGTH